MGALCCCFLVKDSQNNEENSTERRCPCFNCNVFSKYAALFRRGSIVAPNQGTASSASSMVLDNAVAENNRSPPLPLPCDATHSDSRQDGQVDILQKGRDNSHKHVDPDRGNGIHIGPNILTEVEEQNVSQCAEETKVCYPDSSMKLLSKNLGVQVGDFILSSEDEDVCPICLEEYTPDNPREVLQCSHEYHLGCLYDWMERSASCPLCIKVMLFVKT